MPPPSDINKTAQEVLDIIPLVMRSLHSKMRQSEDLPDPAHYRVLYLLRRGPLNLSEMAEVHQVTLPTMSKTISILKERGIVQRNPSEKDRRQVVIALTPDGHALLDRIQKQVELHIAQVLKSLSEQERAEVTLGLAALKKAFLQS